MPLPLCCPSSSRPRRLDSLAEQMWPVSTMRIKITNYLQKQGHSEPGLQQQHLTWAQRKLQFSLQVQLTNIYSGPVIYSASCFSPGLLCQGRFLILEISPEEAALGCQQVGLQEVSPVWRNQCLEGLVPMCSLG